MSFILENNLLINDLLKAAGYKVAQTSQDATKDILLRTLESLKQSLSVPNIKVEGEGGVMQKDLLNLQSITQWLITNKVRVDNHRVAYGKGEAVDPNDANVQYIGTDNRVYVSGLSTFLQSIRKQAADSGNIYFQELVGQIIEDANKSVEYNVGLEPEETKEKAPKKEDDASTPEETHQVERQKSQQEGQQVSYTKEQSVKESLQQGGSAELILPYETGTNIIAFRSFETFISQCRSLLSNPSFVAEMGTYIPSIGNLIGYADSALNKWQITAPPNAVQGGFVLNSNVVYQLKTFLSTYAENNVGKARDMFVVLSDVFTRMNAMLNILKVSPTMRDLVGDNVLSNQISAGQAYLSRVSNLIQQLNHMAGR